MQRRTLLLSLASAPLLAVPLIARPDPGGSLPGLHPDAAGAGLRAAPRLVVLDWGLAETVLALGITPAGIAEIGGYHENGIVPPVPAGVTDVGLRLTPNLELLQQLAPDLILINSSQESQRDMLERIAPVRAFAIYTDAGAPYAHSQDVTREIGRLCQCEAAAQALIDRVETTLARCRVRLAAWQAQPLPSLAPAGAAGASTPGRAAHLVEMPNPASRGASGTMRHPLYLIRFFDGRHIGVYGARSVFQDVMDRLDLVNAWTGATDYWGIAVAGLEKLAAVPEARILYFGPLPAGVGRTLASNRLWHALPPVVNGRVNALPPFWGFGMLLSAERFAKVLTRVLTEFSTHVAAAPAGDA